MSCFVEISFDNTDGRMSIEKEEVAIKRGIGMRKDQSFLDKKVVNKTDIRGLLKAVKSEVG